jgi:excisionase family DNA binding protein
VIPTRQTSTFIDDGRARAVIALLGPQTRRRSYRRALRPAPLIPDPSVRPVMSADEVFAELGIERSTGYKAIRDGTFPLPVLRVGRIIRIPTAAVRRLLELDASDEQRSQGVA